MPLTQVQSNKTFTDLYGDHVNNLVIFGDDSRADRFYAQVKMEFWGENWITFEDKAVSGVPSLVAGRLVLDSGPRTTTWYQHTRVTGTVNYRSSLKWLVGFKQRPPLNKYAFDLGGQWREFDWFYQAPLAEEFGPTEEFVGPDGDTWIRPVNWRSLDGYSQRPLRVDGSYAVYHREKRDCAVGQKNYRTGKVLHIYRPLATDAVGKTAWVDIRIENGTYEAIIPQNFLDEAVYPVVVNDEFGYHTAGGTEHTISASGDHINMAGTWSPAADGSATAIYTYQRAGTKVTHGIQSDNSGVPQTTLKDGAEINSTPGSNWYGGSLDSALAITAATSYWLGYQQDDSTAWNYDTGTKNFHRYNPGTENYVSGECHNTAGTTETFASRNYSVYVVYTPSGGGANIKAAVHHLKTMAA